MALSRRPDLDYASVVDCFQQYLEAAGYGVSRAEIEANPGGRLAGAAFHSDIRPLAAATGGAADAFDVAGVLAASLVVLMGSHRPSPANAVGRTPALNAVWQPFLDGNTPILISFESRLFLAAGNIGLVQDFEVTDWASSLPPAWR